MGCSLSSSRSTPAVPGTASISSRSHRASTATTRHSTTPFPTRRTHPTTNALLLLPPPFHSNRGRSARTWTPRQLRHERLAFFETRVTGHPETWQAVRMAVELVREEGDVAGAAGVLEASGCSCPTGDLGEGVWDERGVEYGLPRWVVADPVDMMEEEEEEVSEEKEGGEDNDDEGVLGTAVGSEAKGKARMGVDAFKIRVRLSDRGTDVLAEMVQGQSVRALIRRVQEELEVTGDTKIKIAYMGKILKDNESLSAQGWQPGHVVNALVFH